MEQLPNIVRERLKSAPSADHADPDLLTAFAEQALPDQERSRLLLHLSRCADCRNVLALAVPPVETASGPLDTARTVWFRWPILRWGAVAACVVIVGSAMLMKREAMVTRSLTPVAIHSDAQSGRFVDQRTDKSPSSPPSLLDSEQASTSVAVEPSRELAADERTKDLKVAPRLQERAATKPPSNKKLVGRNLAGGRGIGGLGVGAALDADKFPRAFAYVPRPAPSGPAPPAKEQAKNSFPQRTNPATLAGADVAQKSETAAVEAEANSPEMDTAAAESPEKREAPGKAKPSSTTAMFDAMKAPALAGAADGQPENSAKEVATRARAERVSQRSLLSRWTISSDGQLQHSVDSGQTWQAVVVAEKATFRALSANGPDVWVGGASGLLFHSSDAGSHWTQVKPVSGDGTLTADIAAIEFTDLRRGKITTSTGEAWITEDAGRTWRKQP